MTPVPGVGIVVDASVVRDADLGDERGPVAVDCLDAVLRAKVRLERWFEVEMEWGSGPRETEFFFARWLALMLAAGLAEAGSRQDLRRVPRDDALRERCARMKHPCRGKLDGDLHLVEAALAGSGRLLTSDGKFFEHYRELRREWAEAPAFLCGVVSREGTSAWILGRLPHRDDLVP